MFFTTLICLNQALQPRVVGPLFILKGSGLLFSNVIGFGFGTSIDMFCDVCAVAR